MKKYLCFLISFFLVAAALPVSHISATPIYQKWYNYPFVAHALGEVNGVDYTNSLEAFEHNYETGKRVFEIDLEFTSDGYVVARHDWSENSYKKLKQPYPGAEEPMSLLEYKALKSELGFTPLVLEDIIDLLKKYPDIYFVTDTKDTDKALVEKKFRMIVESANHDKSLLKRIVPQLYNQPMLKFIEDVFKFDSYIYTLYQSPDTDDEVVDFINKENGKIMAVTMTAGRATPQFITSIKKTGAKSYVHTINDIETVYSLKKVGVDGFYTDNATEIKYNEYALNRFRQYFHAQQKTN